MSWKSLKNNKTNADELVDFLEEAAFHVKPLHGSILKYLGLTEDDIKTVEDLDTYTGDDLDDTEELTYNEVEKAREEITARDDSIEKGSLHRKASRLLHQTMDALLAKEISVENVAELRETVQLVGYFEKGQM